MTLLQKRHGPLHAGHPRLSSLRPLRLCVPTSLLTQRRRDAERKRNPPPQPHPKVSSRRKPGPIGSLSQRDNTRRSRHPPHPMLRQEALRVGPGLRRGDTEREVKPNTSRTYNPNPVIAGLDPAIQKARTCPPKLRSSVGGSRAVSLRKKSFRVLSKFLLTSTFQLGGSINAAQNRLRRRDRSLRKAKTYCRAVRPFDPYLCEEWVRKKHFVLRFEVSDGRQILLHNCA